MKATSWMARKLMIVHTYTLWVHGEGVGGLLNFFFSVICYASSCTTAVSGTTSCCSSGWHRHRSPAVALSLARSPSLARRRSPVAATVRWPLAALVGRPPLLARSPAVVRSPAAALVITITTYRYTTTTPEVCTHAYYIVESQCMHS